MVYWVIEYRSKYFLCFGVMSRPSIISVCEQFTIVRLSRMPASSISFFNSSIFSQYSFFDALYWSHFLSKVFSTLLDWILDFGKASKFQWQLTRMTFLDFNLPFIERSRIAKRCLNIWQASKQCAGFFLLDLSLAHAL